MTIIGNWRYDGDYTNEEVGQLVPLEGSNAGKEIRDWTTGGTQGKCVIWGKGFPLYHLLGFKVKGVGGDVGKWRHQSKRWWSGSAWKGKKRETYNICWDLDCVLNEGDQMPVTQDTFWKISKGHVVYVGGKKPFPHPEGWKR